MKRSAWSLEARLVAVSALWIVLALGVAAALLASLYRDHVEAEHADRVGVHLEELLAGLEVGPDGRLELQRELPDPLFRRPYSGLYWDVRTADGVELRSRSLWDYRLPADAVAGPDAAPVVVAGPEGQRLRVWSKTVRYPGRATPITLRVAADGRRVEAMAASFTRTLAGSLAALAAGILLMVVVQVQIGLAPLRRLQRAATALRQGDVDGIDGEFPVEVRPLVEDLNAVLHENRELLARARAQAGNLAHALKTPLAVVRNALPKLQPPAATAGVAEEIDRMHLAIERHLVRARAGSAHLHGRRVAVATVLDDLLRAVRRMHGERLRFELEVDPAARFRGDAADLQEMVGNLLDNAGKWARSRVRVRAGVAAETLEIAVEDDGPGIPAERRADAVRRGVRLDTTRPGTGLGLQIVDELAQVFGGRLELADAELGGLAARLRLPLGTGSALR